MYDVNFVVAVAERCEGDPLAIGLPQDAMNQWRNDRMHWEAVINSRVKEIGVGYVFSKFSSYGGYWTVNMGGP